MGSVSVITKPTPCMSLMVTVRGTQNRWKSHGPLSVHLVYNLV